ncbi:unnamed protein product [Arabidopsis arenosa]|uniref:Uncharacterized protein n=1 Tax=Arabidopsis arenosa TaxID=38785 RepID=A0A8S1ZS48_ARAAE|nr:unnamed protein product [Arabidopsis arenosa]
MDNSFLIADTSSLVIGLVLILNGLFISAAQQNGLNKIHIVHLGAKQHDTPELVTKSHYQILEPLLGSKEAARNSLVYNYKHGFSGFAAKLTASQAKNLSAHPEVLCVVPSRVMRLKTTRTFDYLGLSHTSPKGLLYETKMGSEAIIGVIDSGIWPESQSFNDTGLGPIPKRWKGKCVSGDGFDANKHCNKKLIGAEFFTEGLLDITDGQYDFASEDESKSPRDIEGHGTHGEGLNTFPEAGFTDLILSDEMMSASIEQGQTQGSIVLAFTPTDQAIRKANSIVRAGCAGIIYAQSVIDPTVCSDVHVPCAVVDYEYGTDILYYIQTTGVPRAKISPSKTLIGRPIASRVPRFSCRGPNSVSPAILKPDIAAPGVNVLSAVTAWKTDPSGEPIFSEGSTRKLADPFDYGGGLINPEKVTDPGLIYDMGIDDYLHYLCSAEYDDASISKLLGKTYKCTLPKPSMLDFNLPSITIPSLTEEVTVTRTVTNVGPASSVYRPVIESPFGIELDVNPKTLVFGSNITKITFSVRVKTSHRVNTDYYFGSLCWTDGVHNVSTPVSVRTKILRNYV